MIEHIYRSLNNKFRFILHAFPDFLQIAFKLMSSFRYGVHYRS